MLFSPQRNQKEGTKPYAVLVIVISAALVLYKSFVVVPAGHVGVIDFLGTVTKKILRPGINLVNPFADVIKMSIKTKEVKETISVPTQEGLSISLEVSGS